ncbi:MAG: ABC transporter ATP-binding protein [Anaerolineaceae bacterium]|nr:ABC transporter ATP-binding protein [Anaerolineaceae bacterium]
MLEVREIHKMYAGKPLLRGVSFDVATGETVCLLGPSGSGKSTLLRIIAGLELPEAGQVLWEGVDLAGVPAHKRNFGLMFQDYALFPHLRVAENVGFGLKMQRVSAAELNRRVESALRQVNLLAFADRRVTDLSGGEQQRVALARALTPGPRLLMLDEPLGALDRALREQLSEELRRLLHQSGVPAIYVTHDQEEAFAIADRLVLLHEGEVAQQGAPQEVYSKPASAWVAAFLDLGNLIPGEVVANAPLLVQTTTGVFQAQSSEGSSGLIGRRVTVLLRPWGAALQPQSAGSCALTGMVEDVVFRAVGYQVILRCNDDLRFQFHLSHAPVSGEALTLYLSPESIQCFV